MGCNCHPLGLVERKVEVGSRKYRILPSDLPRLMNKDKVLFVAETSDGMTSSLFAMARGRSLSENPDTISLYVSAFEIPAYIKNNCQLDACLEGLIINSEAFYKYHLSPESIRGQLSELIDSGKIRLLVDDIHRLEKSDQIRVSNYLLKCPKFVLAIPSEIYENRKQLEELVYGWNQEPFVIKLIKLSKDEMTDFIGDNFQAIRYRSLYESFDQLLFEQNLTEFSKAGFNLRTMTDLIAAIVSTGNYFALSPIYAILADQFIKADLGYLGLPFDRKEFSAADNFVIELGRYVNKQAMIGASFPGYSEATCSIDLDALLKFTSEIKIRKYLKFLNFTQHESRLEICSLPFTIFAGAVHKYYAPEEYHPNIITKLSGGKRGALQQQISHYSRDIHASIVRFPGNEFNPFARSMATSPDKAY
jgi:hypothetical protein